ncbi:MAG: ComEA family DNA-binding protein [Clostridia bacterium]|nr:ComEA family DNA-binding protein [Clostridia bacterium]
MRWIERRAEQIALPAEISAASTDTAAERALPESGGLDINTATKEELMELPGIGEKKAQAIIDYRNEYGAFLDAAEIMEVDGIGEGIFEKIRDLIRV